jgi:hypothetical protein
MHYISEREAKQPRSATVQAPESISRGPTNGLQQAAPTNTPLCATCPSSELVHPVQGTAHIDTAGGMSVCRRPLDACTTHEVRLCERAYRPRSVPAGKGVAQHVRRSGRRSLRRLLQQKAPMILIEASVVPATGFEPVTQGL